MTPIQAAKRACEASDWSLSNLALQKILYIAHMYYMGQNNSQLIEGAFEAWDYGPVLPDVYHKAKTFGSGPVKNIFRSTPAPKDEEEVAFLDDAVRQLSEFSPSRLVAVTHWKDGAWAKHYKAGRYGVVIPNEAILEEYLARQARQ